MLISVIKKKIYVLRQTPVAMSRPKNPSAKQSPKASRENREEHERTIPGTGNRTPEYVKQNARVVNEDEQNKVVNRREDNAQAQEDSFAYADNSPDRPSENQNDRMGAGDDNSEVNPRPRKVN